MNDGRAGFKEDYRGMFRRSVATISLLTVSIVALFIYSLSISQYPVSFSETFDILVAHLTGNSHPTSFSERLKDAIVWNDNLPRATGGVAVGIILAVGGAVMQNMIKNPLADPYTTGISSGAYFGVTVHIVVGVSIIPFAEGGRAQIANAFVFALIPASAIVVMSSFRKTGPTMMILIGVGVMYLFSASTTMFKVVATPEALSEIYVWGVGSIGKIVWDDVPLLLGTSAAMTAAMMFLSRKIDVLASDDKLSVSLGVDPNRMRLVLLVIISISTAIAVCFTGTIGFVGLVGPHLARMFVGSNTRYLVPCSACVGALLLLAADCIARNAGTTGLPVGVITALVGSPLFLYFLIRQKKGAWG